MGSVLSGDSALSECPCSLGLSDLPCMDGAACHYNNNNGHL